MRDDATEKCGGEGGFDAIVPAYVEGAGEALRAARHLKSGTRLLRVAPLAAIPYAAELDKICGSCFQRCDDDDGSACAHCGIARLCRRCAAGPALEQHAHECHALSRLRDGDSGLTLAHNDLRLLLRLLSVRRRWLTTTTTKNRDDDDEMNTARRRNDPAADAAAEAGDVIVDDYDALLELMSGLEGGDDGALPDDAVATLYEVAKQAKYMVAPELRASVEEYVSLLGRLQLNGFEMTAATACEDGGGGRGGHRPIGVGVFPSVGLGCTTFCILFTDCVAEVFVSHAFERVSECKP